MPLFVITISSMASRLAFAIIWMTWVSFPAPIVVPVAPLDVGP